MIQNDTLDYTCDYHMIKASHTPVDSDICICKAYGKYTTLTVLIKYIHNTQVCTYSAKQYDNILVKATESVIDTAQSLITAIPKHKCFSS